MSVRFQTTHNVGTITCRMMRKAWTPRIKFIQRFGFMDFKHRKKERQIFKPRFKRRSRIRIRRNAWICGERRYHITGI